MVDYVKCWRAFLDAPDWGTACEHYAMLIEAGYGDRPWPLFVDVLEARDANNMPTAEAP